MQEVVKLKLLIKKDFLVQLKISKSSIEDLFKDLFK